MGGWWIYVSVVYIRSSPLISWDAQLSAQMFEPWVYERGPYSNGLHNRVIKWGPSCFIEGTKCQQVFSLSLVSFSREESSILPPRGCKLVYHHSGCSEERVCVWGEGVGSEVDSQVDFHLVPFFSVVLCSPLVKGGSGDLVSHCCSNTQPRCSSYFQRPPPHPILIPSGYFSQNPQSKKIHLLLVVHHLPFQV